MKHCYEPDRELETEMNTILCNTCSHKRSGITCNAFPNGIPEYILRNNEHFISVPGDNGVVYSPIITKK